MNCLKGTQLYEQSRACIVREQHRRYHGFCAILKRKYMSSHGGNPKSEALKLLEQRESLNLLSE